MFIMFNFQITDGKMSIYKRKYVWSVQRNIHAKIKKNIKNIENIIYETENKTDKKQWKKTKLRYPVKVSLFLMACTHPFKINKR